MSHVVLWLSKVELINLYRNFTTAAVIVRDLGLSCYLIGTSLVCFQSNGLQFTRTIFSNSTPLLRCRLQRVKKVRVTISRKTILSFNCPCCHVYLNKVMSDDVSIFILEAFYFALIHSFQSGVTRVRV
jgi:hypothetical protein